MKNNFKSLYELILSIKDKYDLKTYIGKLVEANIVLLMNMICTERLLKFCSFSKLI